MIIGILDCDILAEDLQPLYGSYAQMLQALFRQIDPACQFRHYSSINQESPDHPDECDAYLVTGSRYSAYDQQPWIQSLITLVQALYGQRKKLLGVCFGHQLIAHALAGETALAPAGWGVGVHHYQVTPLARRIFDFLPPKIALLVSHRDQVSQLPPQAQLIACSDFCPHAAYLINDQVLCFQGHPEFVPAYANALMQKRKAIIPPDTYQRAQASLSQPTHHLLIGQCMLQFVKQSRRSDAEYCLYRHQP